MARSGSCEEYVWGLTFKRKQICKVVWGHSNIVRVSANEKHLGGKSRVSRLHKFQSLKAVLCTVDGIESRRNIYSCGVYSISAWYFWVYLQWWDNWGKEIWKQLLIYRTKYLNQSIRMKTFYLSLQGKRFFSKMDDTEYFHMLGTPGGCWQGPWGKQQMYRFPKLLFESA